jgi:hypothetical protein
MQELDDTTPRAEYLRRHEDRRGTAERQERRVRALADARLAVFVAGLVIAWLVLGAGWLSAGWLTLPVVLFVILVVLFERASRARRHAGRAAAFYEAGLARLDDRWAGAGVPGTRFRSADHPYAEDLDLFGTGSLFERLCTARTRAGEDTLASWLLGPASPDEVLARQEAVAELRPRLVLREDLALLGADVRAGVEPEALAAWGQAPPVRSVGSLRVAATVLALLGVGTLLAWAAGWTGRDPFLIVLVVEILFALALRGRIRGFLATVDERAHDLSLLAELLERLEREPVASPRLLQIWQAFDVAGHPPSRRIARLARLLHLLDARRNQFFAPVGAVLLWTEHLALAIERWRVESGPAIAGWLAAVGEVEALGALAAYAFENSADPFPEVIADGHLLDAEGLGHPLIPADRCVRNDLRLGDGLRVLLVSGSNMSGKSTLLRAVGVSVVLALAGAPVRAHRLKISPLAIGATLRIQDSLQAGKSRFYAEITRVRQLVDLAGSAPPLLFLLDELFAGTNSHDRRQGAEAVVRRLIDRGAIGLVTTHDLALAEIADGLAPRAANVHFEDHLEDGVMTFDYRMRPGVVQHSNALALMRAVGLEV